MMSLWEKEHAFSYLVTTHNITTLEGLFTLAEEY